MQVRELPRGGQYSLKGNVPVDIQPTVSCLPRPMDENFTIAVQLKKKLSYKKVDFKRHETELKWIKLLQTPFPLGFNDNIYNEGNISKMPDFDVFSLLEIQKRNSRSHGIRKKGNGK